jgi:hypothetical protein
MTTTEENILTEEERITELQKAYLHATGFHLKDSEAKDHLEAALNSTRLLLSAYASAKRQVARIRTNPKAKVSKGDVGFLVARYITKELSSASARGHALGVNGPDPKVPNA